jgi:hypothetical protein
MDRNQRRVVLIFGDPGNGKSHLAKLLRDNHGGDTFGGARRALLVPGHAFPWHQGFGPCPQQQFGRQLSLGYKRKGQLCASCIRY